MNQSGEPRVARGRHDETQFQEEEGQEEEKFKLVLRESGEVSEALPSAGKAVRKPGPI